MLPTTGPDTWTQGMDFPSRLFGTGVDDYELYEEDGEFVLTVELPGYAREEISVSWDEGVLHIGAEHEDDARTQRKTYRRTFRVPKEIEPEEISAHYRNGILEVRLPILGTQVSGVEIEVDG